MIQNPNPSTNKIMSKPQRPAVGSLKRDINLMPANENSEKIARRGTIALGIFVGVLLLAYFAIYIPAMATKDMRDKADIAQSQLDSMADVDKQFNDNVAQRNSLQAILNSLQQSDKNYLQPADVFGQQLPKACPESITLTLVIQSSSGLEITGTAPEDGSVAQFIVNLESLVDKDSQPVFQQVALANVGDTSNNTDASQKRTFTIKALFGALIANTPAVTPSPSPSSLAAPTATANGGNSK